MMAMRIARLRTQAFIGLAEVEFQLGHYQEAKQYASRAVDNRGGWSAQLVLGNIYYKLKEYRKAMAFYQAVLEIKKNHREARRNLEAAQRHLD